LAAVYDLDMQILAVLRSNFTRFSQRFLFLYLLLYFIPLPNGFRDDIASSIAKKLFEMNLDLSTASHGSADRTADYAWILLSVWTSWVAAFLWSLIDQREAADNWIRKWGFLALRIVLGWAMISYGIIKLIPSQFPEPSLIRLIQPYGSSSPMALLWTFMGASRSYSIFAGAVEIVSGIFLLLPRLNLLGALLAFGATLNVFILNLSYDVPVKTYSFHLSFISFLLLAPHLSRFFKYFFLQQPVVPLPEPHYFRSPHLNRMMLAIPMLVGLFICANSLKKFDKKRNAVPLHGIWTVERTEGVVDFPWIQVVFEIPTLMAAQKRDGSIELIKIEELEEHSFLTLRRKSEGWKATFHVTEDDPNSMTLKALWENQQISIKLRKQNPSTFLLKARGFHWVNESPFNE
jgi:uncharacterized membrane protein YphA (DoxX/SURF4 family)